MRGLARRVPILALLLLIGATAPAAADPIQLFSGAVSYFRLDPGRLIGDATTGEHVNVQFGSLLLDSRRPDHACFDCVPGSIVSLSQSESYPNQDATTGADGSVKVGGIDYWLQSLDFQIDAGSLILPNGPSTTVNLSSPFSFRGTIVGRSTEGETLTFNFFGGGTATATFFDNKWFSTSYRFEGVGPVPEPGTLLLLGGPALLALLRRHRSSLRRAE